MWRSYRKWHQRVKTKNMSQSGRWLWDALNLLCTGGFETGFYSFGRWMLRTWAEWALLNHHFHLLQVQRRRHTFSVTPVRSNVRLHRYHVALCSLGICSPVTLSSTKYMRSFMLGNCVRREPVGCRRCSFCLGQREETNTTDSECWSVMWVWLCTAHFIVNPLYVAG